MSSFSMKSLPEGRVPFAVSRSRIHGSGLFATRAIVAGSNVWSFPTTPSKDQPSSTVLTLSDGTAINVSVSTAKYFNHSCAPNCVAEVDSPTTFVVKAIKNIEKGEELLFNYGYELNGHESRPCNCGAIDCIGSIVSMRKWRGVISSQPAAIVEKDISSAQPVVQSQEMVPVVLQEAAKEVDADVEASTPKDAGKRSVRNKRAKARRKARRKTRSKDSSCGPVDTKALQGPARITTVV